MMGTKARVVAPLPPVCLEDLVPPDHFCRHLAQVLDLGFVRDFVRDAYADTGRPNRNETRGTYRRTADFRISTTDLDATPVPQRDGHTHLGYQDHDVVDGGQARIVLLVALVAPAEVQENQPARVYAILDNLHAHRALDVLLWALAHPRWEFVFQPKYAAYLNLLEPWWKVLRSLAFAGRRFETWPELCHAVAAATAYWNAHRHPFLWGRRKRRRPARPLGIARLPVAA